VSLTFYEASHNPEFEEQIKPLIKFSEEVNFDKILIDSFLLKGHKLTLIL